MKVNRRQFIKGASSVLVAGGLQACNLPNQQKPNVLFIAIDDLNDWIGSLKGHPQALTPNIDKLMASSVNFTNAHCSAPVCSASRNSLLTGLHPTTTGWYTNAKFEDSVEDILKNTPTLPEHFKNNGYNTMAGGKIFHTGTSDYRSHQWHKTLPEYEITNEYLLSKGYGYGALGKKDHKYYPFPVDGGDIVQGMGGDTRGKSLCWGALERKDIPKGGVMPDEYIADWAVTQLMDTHIKPFFMAVGFIRPHVPFTAPKEYFDKFPLDSIIMPKTDPTMDDIPLYGKAMALGIIPGGDHNAVTSLSDTLWKELVRANLACINFVDDQVGKVLNALEDSEHKNNTAVILWSDHGQNFGEHKNWRKMSLWEESTRVPMSIKLPGQTQGVRCEQPVSLLDIYPTLSQLCQLPSVSSNQGQVLQPLFTNPTLEWSTPVLTTWGYKNHALRDQHWRYIQYRDGQEELYYHIDDPNEHHNLANDHQYQSKLVYFRQFIPEHQALPANMNSFDGDFLEKRIQLWQQQNGIPKWLT